MLLHHLAHNIHRNHPVRHRFGLPALLFLFFAGCATPVYRENPVPPATVSQQLAPPVQSLIQTATQSDWDRSNSIPQWRDVALTAWPAARAEVESGLIDGPHVKAHREATQFMILAAQRQAARQNQHWAAILAQHGVDVQGHVALKPPQNWSIVTPAQEGEVHGFHSVKRAPGLGLPLVLERKVVEPRSPEEQHFPPIICAAATAIVYPAAPIQSDSSDTSPPIPADYGQNSQNTRIVCWLYDPFEDINSASHSLSIDPEIKRTSFLHQVQTSDVPLATDLTTPLARELRDTKLSIISKLAVLAPSIYDKKTGLYMLDPYQPGKIPVILVHGLASSPMAWKNAYNELAHDPELASKYQFWLYFYSTGNPILVSATRFRAHLADIRNQVDPSHSDPAFDNMVVVGHSMGGLLTRSVISNSHDIMWSALARIPFHQLNLPPEEKQLVQRAMFFEPVPGIRRAIFLATPHRGSPLGDAWYGRLGSSLVRVPTGINHLRKDIIAMNSRDAFDPEFLEGRQSSIAQLRWENPVLKALNSLPISQTIAYHSIVGLQSGQSPESGGDGVVPYVSAHIDGALSELVVPSNHSVQETLPAAQEIKRILALHWSEFGPSITTNPNAENASATEVAVSPTPVTRPPDGQTPIRYIADPSHKSTQPTPIPDMPLEIATEALLESIRR